MSGYLSAAQLGQAPYELRIELAVCECASYPRTLATGRRLDRIIKPANGYWSLLCGFWGDVPNITLLTVVDVRDGVVMWRNGRLLKVEDENGEKQDAGRDRVGPGGRLRRDSGVGQAGRPGGVSPDR